MFADECLSCEELVFLKSREWIKSAAPVSRQGSGSWWPCLAPTWPVTVPSCTCSEFDLRASSPQATTYSMTSGIMWLIFWVEHLFPDQDEDSRDRHARPDCLVKTPPPLPPGALGCIELLHLSLFLSLKLFKSQLFVLVTIIASVVQQRCLLRGVHGEGEEDGKDVCHEVREEETEERSQPGERDHCAEKVCFFSVLRDMFLWDGQ